MRRGLALAVIVSLLAAASAWADETITSRPQNAFTFPVTTIDQGEKVTLTNLDVAGHDVVSEKTGDDGKPLFRSPIVEAGQSAPVEGAEFLVTGTYDFFCSVHSGMDATLEVTSAGQPEARPQPEVTVKIRTGDLQKLVETRKLKLEITSAKSSLTVGARATAGKSSIALGSKKMQWDGGTGRVTLKLTQAARDALRKRKRATVIATVTAEHPGGHTERATAKRTLD